jgi:hypothetical protein
MSTSNKEVIRQSTLNNYFYALPDANKNGVEEYYQQTKDSSGYREGGISS